MRGESLLKLNAFPAKFKQLTDCGNNMIYGTHEIRMDSACMCNWLHQMRTTARTYAYAGGTDARLPEAATVGTNA